MFASTSEDSGSGNGSWGVAIGSSYGGSLVYLNNGSDSTFWTSADWSKLSSYSMAFTADFAPTPEPASLALAGLGGLALLLRKRK